MVLLKVVPERKQEFLDVSSAELEELAKLASQFELAEMTALARYIAGVDDELRYSKHTRFVLELMLLQLCSNQRAVSLEHLWSQIESLEERLRQYPEAALPGAVATPVAAENVFSEAAPAEAALEPGRPQLVIDSIENPKPRRYTDEVREHWEEILDQVGQANRRVQALLRDAALAAAEPGWVELTPASDYHRSGLSKEDARRLIEQAMAAVLGQSTRLRLAEAAVAPARGEAAPEGKLDPAMVEAVIKQEPLVQKTLELFGGKIVDIINKPN
jgi:DNA polymerase III gamma/tau subunit